MLRGWRIRDDIQVVEEYPKNFLSNVDHFLTPDSVGPGLMHFRNPAWWLGGLGLRRIAKVGKEDPSTIGHISGGRRGEIRKEKADYDIASDKLARAFLRLIKQHTEEGGE